jgi:two-component system, OmpR family, response regulator
MRRLIERASRDDAEEAVQVPSWSGRALVVDDEENVCFVASTALRLDGWTVHVSSSGSDALAIVDSFRPDVIVLDVMLGDIDGFDLCELLRRRAVAAPVIFLTARGTVADRVRGLTIGGDDYLTKPFSVEELVARCRLLANRAGAGPPRAVLRYADLELDDDAHRVTRAGHAIHLSPTEYRLLRYLLLNAERVVSRSQILDRVWDYGFAGDTSNVESFISFLRRKVDMVEPKLLHTVRGVGYVLRVEHS